MYFTFDAFDWLYVLGISGKRRFFRCFDKHNRRVSTVAPWILLLPNLLFVQIMQN